MSLLLKLASGLLLAAALAAPAAQARILIDRAAGIKMDVPFHVTKALRGPEIEAVLKRQLGRLPEGVHYTSAVYAPGSVPFVLVWTRPAVGGISRQLVDRLVDGGRGGFSFNRETLLGEGELPDQRGYHVRLLLQLVRDRYTYVGYYYKTAAELAGFEHIKRTLTVGHKSHLSYRTLPETPGTSWGKMAMEIMAALGLAALVGAGAVYAYKWMGREIALPPGLAPAARDPVAEPGATPVIAEGPRL